MKMEECPQFGTCSAPLCPLDTEIEKRIWYSGEPVCKKTGFGALRWLRKQRKFSRGRVPKKYSDTPLTVSDLINASKPREMSEEKKKAVADRFKKYRALQKNTSI
jgi:hypothetical protein